MSTAFFSRAWPRRAAAFATLAGMILVMGLTLHSNSPATVDANPVFAVDTPAPPSKETEGGGSTASQAAPPPEATPSPMPTAAPAPAATPATAQTPAEAAASVKIPTVTEMSFLEAFAQNALNSSRPTQPAAQSAPRPSAAPSPGKTPAPTDAAATPADSPAAAETPYPQATSQPDTQRAAALPMPTILHAAPPTVQFIPTKPPPVPTQTQAQAPTPMPASASASGSPPLFTHSTADLRIEIHKHYTKNVVYFTAEIWLTDASQLKSAFSSDRFDGAREPVRDIARRHDAILAVNGDFATFNNGGIIIRDGVLYRSNRSTRHLLLIDRNGDFIPYVNPPDNAEEAAAGFIRQGVRQTLVFGPLLVENGEAVPLPNKYFISTGMALEPRTAIGQIGPLHYLWIVVDGRQQGYSQGVSLPRLQELFLEHGVKTAFNLDGGGSTTLYYNGDIINKPANSGGRQRDVPDILYIGP